MTYFNTCTYRDEKPSLKALLNGRRLEAHIYMERIPIEQVPVNDKECDKWMYNLYEKKVMARLITNRICLNPFLGFNELQINLNIYNLYLLNFRKKKK